MREHLRQALDGPTGRRIVLTAILLNAILAGLSTYTQATGPLGHALDYVDDAFLAVFTLELFARVLAAPSVLAWAKDPWNLFDALIVGICFTPGVDNYVSVVRILRVLRALRTIVLFPKLRLVVSALLRSVPSMGHIGFLLGLLVYVYAVIGTLVFRDTVPEYFVSLHRSALTLFQVVTLEGWNEILALTLVHHSGAWMYFVSFIFLGTFILFNLFVGVIVANLEAETVAQEQEGHAQMDDVLGELRALRQEIAAVREALPEGPAPRAVQNAS